MEPQNSNYHDDRCTCLACNLSCEEDVTYLLELESRVNTPARKPLWKLIVWLIAFTVEIVAIAAGFLYVAFYVPQFFNTRGLVLYVGLPFMLILACIVAWPNIEYHFTRMIKSRKRASNHMSPEDLTEALHTLDRLYNVRYSFASWLSGNEEANTEYEQVKQRIEKAFPGLHVVYVDLTYKWCHALTSQD